MNKCPNCFVIVDTTQKTLQAYKGGINLQEVPEDLKNRLWAALERKMAARKKVAELILRALARLHSDMKESLLGVLG